MKCSTDKILIYGAGVIGSIYAARLSEYGYNVTVLARGKRLSELRKNGLLHEKNGIKSVCVKVVSEVSKTKNSILSF